LTIKVGPGICIKGQFGVGPSPVAAGLKPFGDPVQP
jgi:hypothetical protein